MFVIRYFTSEETALKDKLRQGKEGFFVNDDVVRTYSNKEEAMKMCEEMRKLFPDTSYSIFQLLPIKG